MSNTAEKSMATYRSPRGLLYYRYRDMRDRVNGKPLRTGMERTAKNCPWKGMELADREEFIAWGLVNEDFLVLFAEWEADGYERRSSPAAHRIDRDRGYTLDNILWMRHAEKSREALERGKETRRLKKLALV